MNTKKTKAVVGAVLAVSWLVSAPGWGAETPPDLTKGLGGIDRSLTYNLGATGMRGWIFNIPLTYLDLAQGRITSASRQILVTHVGEKSPADGVMKVDDIILGIDDQPFTDDARKTLALAIQESEKSPEKNTRNIDAQKTNKDKKQIN